MVRAYGTIESSTTRCRSRRRRAASIAGEEVAALASRARETNLRGPMGRTSATGVPCNHRLRAYLQVLPYASGSVAQRLGISVERDLPVRQAVPTS
jgi:hypothetical protein